MDQVGGVFALEVSRLARSNLDGHRLLELCALTETVVIDQDGCYDPSDFNEHRSHKSANLHHELSNFR